MLRSCPGNQVERAPHASRRLPVVTAAQPSADVPFYAPPSFLFFLSAAPSQTASQCALCVSGLPSCARAFLIPSRFSCAHQGESLLRIQRSFDPAFPRIFQAKDGPAAKKQAEALLQIQEVFRN